MMDKERLEDIDYRKDTDTDGYIVIDQEDYEFLYEQAERVQYLEFYVEGNSKKSVELNLFLQERNRTEYLGLHVVDAVMRHVQELEGANTRLLEAFDTKTRVHESLLKDYAVLKVRVEELEEECNRYREIFDKIENTVIFTFPDKKAIYEVADILDELEESK